MKIQISEIQAKNLFGLIKENKLTDKEFDDKSKWFKNNETCIRKQFPKIELGNPPFFASFEEPITDRFGRPAKKRTTVNNDGEMSIVVPRADRSIGEMITYYKWRCDGDEMNIERNTKKNEELWDRVFGKLPNSSSKKKKNIPQAKSISDVENGKGYIIEKMQGEQVRELQRMLMKLGYDLGTYEDDGIFGDMTKKAVEKFQKDVGIKPKNSVFGVFGPITLKKLKEKLKEEGF